MWPLYVLLSKFSRTEEEDSAQGSTRESSVLCKHSPTTPLSSSYFAQVPHINQLRTWDCGLACVLMVLRTLGITHSDMQQLQHLCSTTSIWTVDLAYLLHKFSVNFSYLTVTLGANPSFRVETFYKEQLSNDLIRVDMLFQKARDAGIYIECRSVSSEEISSLIRSGEFIAIALVDQYKLSHFWLEDICMPDFCNDGPGYTGHYVVICGYDADTDEFEIRDPASSRKHERVTSRCLERARKSFGTDEDLLLIRLQKEEAESTRNDHCDLGVGRAVSL